LTLSLLYCIRGIWCEKIVMFIRVADICAIKVVKGEIKDIMQYAVVGMSYF